MYTTRLQESMKLMRKTKRAVHFNVLHEAGKRVTVDEGGKDDGKYLFIAKGIAIKCRFVTILWRIKRYFKNIRKK